MEKHSVLNYFRNFGSCLDLCRFVLEANNVEKHSILGSFSSIFAPKLKLKMASWWRLKVAYVET